MSTLDKLHYALNLNKTKRQQIITKALKSNDYKSIKKELTSKLKNTNSSRVKADIDFVNSYTKIVKGGANNSGIFNTISRGQNPLLEAVSKNNIDDVKSLLDNGAYELINNRNIDGNTALIIASIKGNKNIVILLLDNGAEIDIKNNNGNTALMLASNYGHKDIVELLLDNGANYNIVNHGIQNTALMMASNNGHADVVQLLLNKGSDPNKINEEGTTALMIASYNGYTDIVKLLLENGSNTKKGYMQMLWSKPKKPANPNLKDIHGRTALMLATNKGHNNIVNLLSPNAQ